MTKYVISESDVKKALRIDSFRNMSKDKIMEFASMVPYLDKDVAISIVNQFPVYKEMAMGLLEHLNSLNDSVIKDNENSRKDVIEARKKIIADLSEMLKQEKLSFEEKDHITDKMIVLAEQMEMHDDKNKEFLKELARTGLQVVCVTLLFGSIVLGCRSKGLPQVS